MNEYFKCYYFTANKMGFSKSATIKWRVMLVITSDTSVICNLTSFQ